MNVLPKSHAEFGKEKYWDEFFSKLKFKPFEWYGEYETLCEVLDKYIRIKDKLLVVGCGNSKLSADLYNVGFSNITNIDISATVVQQMKDKYSKICPQMTFERMDIFEMEFENDTYNVVLDKGTLDAIFVDPDPDTVQKVDKMFSEISRVLKFGGRYICISLLQEHILQKILDWFLSEGWMIRVNRCAQAEKTQESVHFPVFAVICTKMKKIPGGPQVLELCLSNDLPIQRVNSKADVVENVKSVQYLAVLKHSLQRRKLTNDDISLDLCCPKSGKVKYRLFVVDSEKTMPLKFAVFIAPHGRETDWLYSTPEGRRELALLTNCERLVVVHLLPEFEHRDLEEAKKDLSASVMELAPCNLKSKVPFLSSESDNDVREVKMQGKSEISGEFSVEDVKVNDDEIYRRLYFSSRPNLVQSEALLKKVQGKKKKKKVVDLKINFDYLACDHHCYMISGVCLLGPKMLCPKVLVIGLGGGGLVMYLRKHLPDAHIEVVELDPVIVDVAKKWFGVAVDNHLSIEIADGLDYMKEKAAKGSCYDFLMLDVDNKDTSLGISCPPVEFLTESVLKTMSVLIGRTGVAMLNLACRDKTLKEEVCSRIGSVFSSVLQKKLEEEINDVICCMNCTLPQSLESSASEFDKHLQKFPDCCTVERIMVGVKELTANVPSSLCIVAS